MRKPNIYFAFSLFILVICWILVKRFALIEDLFLPSPGQIINAFAQLFSSGSFIHDIIASVYRVLAAFLISAIIAIPLAILICSYNAVRQTVSPYIDFIRYLPVPALIPLTILFFG